MPSRALNRGVTKSDSGVQRVSCVHSFSFLLAPLVQRIQAIYIAHLSLREMRKSQELDDYQYSVSHDDRYRSLRQETGNSRTNVTTLAIAVCIRFSSTMVSFQVRKRCTRLHIRVPNNIVWDTKSAAGRPSPCPAAMLHHCTTVYRLIDRSTVDRSTERFESLRLAEDTLRP